MPIGTHSCQQAPCWEGFPCLAEGSLGAVLGVGQDQVSLLLGGRGRGSWTAALLQFPALLPPEVSSSMLGELRTGVPLQATWESGPFPAIGPDLIPLCLGCSSPGWRDSSPGNMGIRTVPIPMWWDLSQAVAGPLPPWLTGSK